MILILAQAFPPRLGGIEGLMSGFARAAAQSGEEVVVFADHVSEASAFDAAQPYQVRRFGGLKPLRRRLKAAAADRFISTRKPRAVLADTWKSVEFLQASAPLAVLAHGSDVLAPADTVKGKRVARALAKAQVVIANSRYTAELASALTNSPVRFVPPGVERLAPPSAATRDALAQRLAGARYIATLARLEPRKGIDVTLRAMALLGASHGDLHYVVAGGGGDKPRLTALAEELGLSARVHFLGPVFDDGKAAVFAGAAVFALPTRREGPSVEGFGLVYREAAQFGVPSIAGAEGGGVDAVAHGETGLVVDGRDAAAVAAALHQLLSDEDLRQRLGGEARARVMAEGLWPQVSALYLAALGER